MTDTAWGREHDGVRFGLRPPAGEAEAGGTVRVDLVCENRGERPVRLFGFQPAYPRSLRVSPPKQDRPFILVSFSDVNVLHPPEAFVELAPGSRAETSLDLSFAFDRRGAGRWPMSFAYEPVRSAAGIPAWVPPPGAPAASGVLELLVGRARSLREAGIDEHTEAALDAALLSGDGSSIERLEALGEGGAAFAARRVARILSTGAESTLGWRALDALERLGEPGLAAAKSAIEDLPHAHDALSFAAERVAHRLGHPPPAEHLPFVTMLDRVIREPDIRGNLLLSWAPLDSPLHGARRLEVFGDGDRVVTARPPGAQVASTRRSRLSPMQMQAMLEALRYAAVWLLRPLRRLGLPDEPRPALEVQLGLGEPFTRRVALWNGEWHQGPASNLASLLDRLAV